MHIYVVSTAGTDSNGWFPDDQKSGKVVQTWILQALPASFIKGRKMDYGFCGNAWEEASRDIYWLRAKIYMDRKQYLLAASCIDSFPEMFGEATVADSLKGTAYQLFMGRNI